MHHSAYHNAAAVLLVTGVRPHAACVTMPVNISYWRNRATLKQLLLMGPKHACALCVHWVPTVAAPREKPQ